MHRILVVDDEVPMTKLIEIYLTKNGYRVDAVTSGEAALQELRKHNYDLVLLDVMMPELSGWDTCKKIRNFSNVPIIMLTARDQILDKVKGLTLGADDYITKPFEEIELLARMEALLRRAGGQSGPSSDEIISHQGIMLNTDTHQVFYLDGEIVLTPKEFHILQTFLMNIGKVMSRERLLELVWGYDFYGDHRIVDSHVKNLREKLRVHGLPIDDMLKTIWGVGYKFV